MRIRIVLVVLLSSCLCAFDLSCPKVPRFPELKTLTKEQALLRLEHDARGRVRLEGVLNARVSGVKGALVRADIDVAVERPGKLLLAVRSFFGQPTQVFASDGETVTIYDGSENVPRFFRGDKHQARLDKFLPVLATPDEVVDVLLGAVFPGLSPKAITVDDDAGTFRLVCVRNDGVGIELLARASDDALLEIVVHAKNRGYRVVLSDHQVHDGIGYPHRFEISMLARTDAPSVILVADDLAYAGTVHDDETFRVHLPEGAAFLPL
jgi:hypothetical protein